MANEQDNHLDSDPTEPTEDVFQQIKDALKNAAVGKREENFAKAYVNNLDQIRREWTRKYAISLVPNTNVTNIVPFRPRHEIRNMVEFPIVYKLPPGRISIHQTDFDKPTNPSYVESVLKNLAVLEENETIEALKKAQRSWIPASFTTGKTREFYSADEGKIQYVRNISTNVPGLVLKVSFEDRSPSIHGLVDVPTAARIAHRK